MTCTGFVRLLHFKPQRTYDGPQVTGGGATVMPTTLIPLPQPLIFSVLHSAKPQLVLKNRFKPTEHRIKTVSKSLSGIGFIGCTSLPNGSIKP